jgi:hypothetical protein
MFFLQMCTSPILTLDELLPAGLLCRCDEEEVEDDVKRRSASKDAMGAKTLCLPIEQPELPPGALCFATGKPAKNWALWGRSY